MPAQKATTAPASPSLERSTPFLVVDRAVLVANIARVHDHLEGVGLSVRPHVKTHKIPQIAQLQLGAGAVGITVATVGEAEVFADAGCTDIFIAFPVWVDADRARRLTRLAGRCRLAIGVESVAGATHLRCKLDPRIEVLVEVDSGHHRRVRPARGRGGRRCGRRSRTDVPWCLHLSRAQLCPWCCGRHREAGSRSAGGSSASDPGGRSDAVCGLWWGDPVGG